MKNVTLSYTNLLFAEGLESMVKRFEGFKVFYKIHNDKLLDNLSKIQNGPAILILELDNPRKSDTLFIESILQTYAGLSILLLSNTPSPSVSFELIEAGISAYLLKSCTSADLQNALTKITDGNNYFCSKITMKLISNKNNNGHYKTNNHLTEREKEILILLVNNCSSSEVAVKLNISQNTVKTHKRNIQSKLGIHSMIGMLLYAVRNNLVEVGYHDLCNACPHYSNN